MQTTQKKQLYRFWTFLRPIKVWYLVIIFVCLLGLTVFALRQNNQRMIVLRDAVYQADEQNGDVEGALRDLRQHVYTHMNTSLSTGNTAVYPPIQLKYTYERLLAQQQESVKQANEQIYTEAQRHCEQLHPESYSGGPRVPCIRDYVANKGVHVTPIPDSLYKFDFASPVWSPDLAGWSLVATVLCGLIAITRMVIPSVLKKFEVL